MGVVVRIGFEVMLMRKTTAGESLTPHAILIVSRGRRGSGVICTELYVSWCCDGILREMVACRQCRIICLFVCVLWVVSGRRRRENDFTCQPRFSRLSSLLTQAREEWGRLLSECG